MVIIDTDHIILETHGHSVTLSRVYAIKEKEAAETAAVKCAEST